MRLVYALETESNDIQDIMSELERGTIFSFPYSYRGGLEADMGFVLLNDAGELMMAVGDPTRIEFIGLQAAVPVVTEEEADSADGGLMDFDMI